MIKSPDSGVSGETDSRLLQAIAQSKEGFALCDSNGCFTYMNAEHLRMFGFGAIHEVLGRPWTILYDEAECTQIKEEVLPVIAQSGSWNGQLMARRIDGSYFHEDLTLSMLPSGGIACNCRDRSEWVGLHQRLAQSERLFRLFLDNLPEGVVIRDPTGFCSYLNRFAMDFNRGMLREAVGRRLEDVLSGEFAEIFCGRDEEALSTRQPVRYETECILADGTSSLELCLIPNFDTNGRILNISILWSDVTARRRHERETAAMLERQQELLTIRSEFVSLVSHEFRTPLSVIQSSHFLIKKAVGESAGPKVARYLALQEEAMKNLRDLVDQVLLLNRAESAPANHGLMRLSPAALLGEIVARFNDVAATPRVRCVLNVPADFRLELDERLFGAAVENLVSNALKYSPPESLVSVEAAADDREFVVTVKDAGFGIPREEQTRIFGTFFRGSNVGNVSGSGLGLAIVRRAAAFHGGRVEFESVENVGSTFCIHLPKTRSGAPGAKEAT